MKNRKEIINFLKESGYRITLARKLIIKVFSSNQKPLSALEMQLLLKNNNLSVNKTTIYRELDFLKKHKIILDTKFTDGINRYELNTKKHHHHIVCVECKKIEDVVVKNDFELEDKIIAKSKNFAKVSHSLEFYGICNFCVNSN